MALTSDYPVPVLSTYNYEVNLHLDYYEENRIEIITWLVDHFGYDDDSGLWDLWEWAAMKQAHFTFCNEEDAMAFKLAWA